jgi:multiple sugar transport system substrate-binding protein
MAAAKNLPDVFWMSSALVKDYSKLGAILNIEDRVAKLDQSKYFPSAFHVLRAPSFDGQMYAFPWAVVTCISYYNIRMFDEAGVAYPTENWTWEDLRSKAKKFAKDTDGDGNLDEWGYSLWGRYTHLFSWIVNNGEILSDAQFNSVTLLSPKGREALKFLSDLVLVDKVAASPAQIKGISRPFSTGKFAMTTEGSWRIDTYRAGLEDPFGITYVPLGPKSGGKHTVWGWADAMSISAFTDHPDESWDWMMFMSGPGRPLDSILGGKIPIWKPNATSEVFLERDKLPANKELILKSVEMLGTKLTMPPGFDEWRRIIEGGFEQVVLGEGEFDQVMDEVQEKVDKVLARAR